MGVTYPPVGPWTEIEGLEAHATLSIAKPVRLENGGTTIRLRGEVKIGEEIKENVNLFILPVGFRVNNACLLKLFTKGGAAKNINVLVNGAVQMAAAIANEQLVLDGITLPIT
jgi:hypothetical protein